MSEHHGDLVTGSLLSIWAHPDDETYLAAGLMARATDRGEPVVCVAASSGEHGTDDPARWPPDRLGRIRRWEAAAAMAVLGVTDHRCLGLPDGRLSEHDEEGVAAVGALIDAVAPDTIVTFGADGVTFHPDHVAVHRWVVAAWEARSRPCRLLFAAMSEPHLARFAPHYEEWGIYMGDERPRGVPTGELAARLTLTGADRDRKLTALHAMASQTRDAVASLGAELFAEEVSEESFVDASQVLGPAAPASSDRPGFGGGPRAS